CEVFVGASASSLRSLGTRDFSPYTTVTVSETLDWSDIGSDGQLVVRVATLGDAATFDRVSLSYAKVSYPQQISPAGDKVFHLRPNPSGKSFLDLSGLPPQSRLFDITDPSRVRQFSIPTAPVVPNTDTERTLLLSSGFVTPSI